jgi:uncharacterized SAM-binding protein YcdF (DUF218 family)
MDFLLTKLLPTLILPVGLALGLLSLAVLTRRRSVILLAITLLWALSTPVLGDALARAADGEQVRIAATSAPAADAIVVLSGGRQLAPGAASISEWEDADRFFGGLELYWANRAPWLVFTGGTDPFNPTAPLEGDVLLAFAQRFGVPSAQLRTTGPVTNTAEEAVAVAAVLADLLSAPAHVLLVTSAFHMPRAAALFERAGMRVTPYPVDFQTGPGRTFTILDFAPNATALRDSERALREFLGRIVYRVW